eukprot:657975-Pleurochrysis_carterae.AAC.5
MSPRGALAVCEDSVLSTRPRPTIKFTPLCTDLQQHLKANKVFDLIVSIRHATAVSGLHKHSNGPSLIRRRWYGLHKYTSHCNNQQITLKSTLELQT